MPPGDLKAGPSSVSWDPAGLLLAAAGSTVSALNFATAWRSEFSLGRTIKSIISIYPNIKVVSVQGIVQLLSPEGQCISSFCCSCFSTPLQPQPALLRVRLAYPAWHSLPHIFNLTLKCKLKALVALTGDSVFRHHSCNAWGCLIDLTMWNLSQFSRM